MKNAFHFCLPTTLHARTLEAERGIPGKITADGVEEVIVNELILYHLVTAMTFCFSWETGFSDA